MIYLIKVLIKKIWIKNFQIIKLMNFNKKKENKIGIYLLIISEKIYSIIK